MKKEDQDLIEMVDQGSAAECTHGGTLQLGYEYGVPPFVWWWQT